ncbi:MAG: PKD domain-containing protein [Flavobacteriia bacterium]|nr:PKD domain-containing protein [Flavobacteriia bacterium]
MTTINSVFLFFSLLFCSVYQSQEYLGKEANKQVNNSAYVRINKERKSVEFVKFKNNYNVIEHDFNTWLLNNIFINQADISFKLIKKSTDKEGFTHLKFQQFYKNIQVENGVVQLHKKGNILLTLNAEYYPITSISSQPYLSKEKCFDIATNKYKIEIYQGGEKAKNESKEKMNLCFLSKKKITSLCYKIDIYSAKPLKRAYVFVDAQTGEIIHEKKRILHTDVPSTANTGYSGMKNFVSNQVNTSQYTLDATLDNTLIATYNLNNGYEYESATNFTSNSSNWSLTGLDQYALDAQYGTQATYNYYKNNFDRNSYDDSGSPLKSYVHYDYSFVNAFWDGERMTYGDGDGVEYGPLTSIDVVGHEITHGVTEYSAGLEYYDESGALNESFSDIFGIVIDYIENPSSANFLMGEQFNINGIPFRNMSNPNEFMNPDCYNGLYYNEPNEVHNNSGVQNFWFYLLSMGGSGTNDLGDVYTVDGIGVENAAKIAYRNLAYYLTPNSNHFDARNFSIQAAEDLFGACSNEVIQVTNAWYAVGVGGVFDPSVYADFTADNTFTCYIPADIQFNNLSLNAGSFIWDFGDGSISTDENPSHTYLNPGEYDVKLISISSGLCGTSGSDTLFVENFITITNFGGPVNTSCIPLTEYPYSDYGISNVQIGNINNSTLNSTEGYLDLTCSQSTTLVAGDIVPFQLQLFNNYSENVNVNCWIDLNNNGLFEQNELVFEDQTNSNTISGTITTSPNIPLNTPLRVRFMIDYYNTISSACDNLFYGQAEDYTLFFIENTEPPIANFYTPYPTVNINTPVQMFDISQHVPTSWLWTFEGANITNSTDQNPIVSYSSLGTYTVQLKVFNSFGEDSITKIDYITVSDFINMCNGINETSNPSGLLYDSGGIDGNYQLNENCSLLIAPDCASSVTLTFSELDLMNYEDYLYIYDGSEGNSNLLWSSDYYDNLSVTSNTGKIYLHWTSNYYQSYSGWTATWSSELYSSEPIQASFSVSNLNPPLNTEVTFTNTSNPDAFSSIWDFGDGTLSNDFNSSHIFNQSGEYTIQLITSNCTTTDTVYQQIIVQDPPIVDISSNLIEETIVCGDSVIVPIIISNTGSGDLIYTLNESNQYEQIDLLILKNGIENNSIKYQNLLSILQNNPHITIEEYTFNGNTTEFSNELSDKEILLFPSSNHLTYFDYSVLTNSVENFISNGKKVIAFGSEDYYTMSNIFDLQLFNGYSGSTIDYPYPVVLSEPSHELVNGLPNTFNSSNQTTFNAIYDVNNSNNLITLEEYSDYSCFSYKEQDSGKIYFIGFTLQNLDSNNIKLTQNVLLHESVIQNLLNNSSYQSDTLHSGESSTVYVTLSSQGYYAGTYSENIVINTNDPNQLIVSIQANITINGDAEIAVNENCLNFPDTFLNGNAQDTLIVFNNGCKTLIIDSILIDNSSFELVSAFDSIIPWSQNSLIVNFHPNSLGNQNGNLTLFNNDETLNICLTGLSIEPPIANISPTAINIELNACGSTTNQSVIISNSGVANLEWNLISDQSDILFYNNGVSSNIISNMTEIIEDNFENPNITLTTTTSPTELENLLQNKDVVVFPYNQNYINYSSYANVIQNYLNNGGNIILCTSYSNREMQLGLFDYAYSYSIYYDYLNNQFPNDPLAEGLPNIFFSSTNTSFLETYDPDFVNVITYYNDNYPVVGHKPFGNGKVIYLGYDYLVQDTNNQKILFNAINYSLNSNNEWVSVSQSEGNVEQGMNQEVVLSFNSLGLEGGAHIDTLIINTNDPLMPTQNIIITMNVSSEACSEFTYMSNGCSNVLSFTNESYNSPSTYLWDFGDGTTSIELNPYHVFSDFGNYTVTLTTCNSFGCNVSSDEVLVDQISTLTNACIPNNIYNQNQGIQSFDFADIYNYAQQQYSYSDLSCSLETDLYQGENYSYSIYFNNTSEPNYFSIYLDKNNDGIFTTDELLDSGIDYYSAYGNFTLSENIVLNTDLRLRVIVSPTIITEACLTGNVFGETEDYKVTVLSEINYPIANFTYSNSTLCDGVVQFENSSSYSSMYSWDFGDGNVSYEENPTHIYTTSGTYYVVLNVSNPFGTDEIYYTIDVDVEDLNINVNISGIFLTDSIINFHSNGQIDANYEWTFGDGTGSLESDPTHFFSAPGVYNCNLHYMINSCSKDIPFTLQIGGLNLNENNSSFTFLCYPNPFEKTSNIQLNLNSEEKISVYITDALGKIVKVFEKNSLLKGTANYEFQIDTIGLYYVVVEMNNTKYVNKLSKI